jgi:hypothetical protein
VGPWTAEGILVRGCGPADVLPLGEPTLHAAVAVAYGLPRAPDDAEVSALAERWRPFRTWVSILLIAHHWGALGRPAFRRGAERSPRRRAGQRPPRRGDPAQSSKVSGSISAITGGSERKSL